MTSPDVTTEEASRLRTPVDGQLDLGDERYAWQDAGTVVELDEINQECSA